MNKTITWIAFASVCIFWGSTYLAIKIGIDSFPPFLFAGIRFLIAGLLVLGFALIKSYSFGSVRDLITPAIVGVLMLFGGNGLVVVAEKTVDSGIASVFVALVPFYIAILELVVLRTVKLSKIGYAGLIIGFLGVFYLTDQSIGSFHLDFDVILLMFAGLFWSLGSVLSKKISKDVHLVSNISVQMLAGGVVLLITGLFMKESLVNVTMEGIYSLIYLIIFGSIIGYSSYILVLKSWPASKAGTYAYVNPIVALLLGYLILDEVITSKMIVAVLIILTSVVIVQKSKVTNI